MKYVPTFRGGKHSKKTKEKMSKTHKQTWALRENKMPKYIPTFKGGKHTQESRAKMSKSRMGRTVWNKGKTGIFKHTEEYKQKMSRLFKGRVISEETRQKIRANHKDMRGPKSSTWKGEFAKERMKHKCAECSNMVKFKSILCVRCTQKGTRHWGWKGGVTSENQKIRHSFEYRSWRTAVFQRDRFTCIWCGQEGGFLHADHIQLFSARPDLRFAIDNGRTLCKSCHLKRHFGV